MAAKAEAIASAAEPDLKVLEREANDRLGEARDQKSKIRKDIEECYYFTAPRRIRSASSQSNSKTAPGDVFELQTSLGFEVSADFLTILADSFMPQNMRWAMRRPPPQMSAGQKEALATQALSADESIFDLIRASNFYPTLAMTGQPDASIGVLAMDIRMANAYAPPHCIGVPIRELEMNLGPDGRVDDRFVVRNTKYRKLRATLPDVQFPAKITNKIATRPNGDCVVQWGYWRLWDKTDDVYWQHVVLVDKAMVHQSITKGEGSQSLIVGRFGATPDFAWPDGPTIKGLPDFRQLDEMRAGFIENIDFTLRPPIYYPDDGVMSFEDGIEPGMGYPKRPGGGSNDIGKIYEPNPLQAAIFDEQNLEKRIRRLHFCDFPEQRGKTPPTAAQWLDEMVEAQKKIGTPGTAFWSEFPYEAFQRFRFIAEKTGVAKPIVIQGQDGKTLPTSLQAYNPAQIAQENQEVLTATRLLQIAGSAFPQTLQVMVDDVKTVLNIKAKLGDKLVELRTPDDIKNAVSQVSQLAHIGPRLTGGLIASTQGAAPGG